MRATPTRTWPRSSRTRAEKGAFPAVLHCFSVRPRAGRDRHRARPLRVVLRHPDLQERRGAPRDRARSPGRPHPGGDRRALSRAAAVSRQAQRAGLRRRTRRTCSPRCAASARTRSRRRRRRISSGCSPKCRGADGRAGRPSALHGAGLRLVARRAAHRRRLGRLRSRQPEEPPAALLAAGRAHIGAGGVTRVLVDTSPDLREQALAAGFGTLDGVLFTHPHADHIHGIDDLRGFVMNMRRRIDIYADAPTMARLQDGLRLLLRDAAGQRVSAARQRACRSRRASR